MSNDQRTRERYAKVDRGVWRDPIFMDLFPGEPSPRLLLMRLLTAPEDVGVPGLFIASAGLIAEDLNWHRGQVVEQARHLEDAGMLQVDWDARLVWIPKKIVDHAPSSPADVEAWADAFRELPGCRITWTAGAGVLMYLKLFGEPFARPFERLVKKPPQPTEARAAAGAPSRLRLVESGSEEENGGSR